MPMPSIPGPEVSTIIEVWSHLSLHLDRVSGERVLEEARRILGKRTPSLRKVQDILKEHRAHVSYVDHQRVIHPLQNIWPKDPDDVAYLAALDRLRGWEWEDVGWGWTEGKVAVALEIKTLIGWPWTDATKRKHWSLPDARPRVSGKSRNATRAGELVIIDEIAARRAIADLQSTEARFDDVYAVLQKKPWLSFESHRRSLVDLPLMRVLTSGLAPLTNLDVYMETMVLISQMLDYFNSELEWEDEYYETGLSLAVPREQHLKNELAILEGLAALYQELTVRFEETMAFLEEFIPASPPEVDAGLDKPGFPSQDNLGSGTQILSFAATCKKTLEELWRTLTTSPRGREINPNLLSHPDGWVFNSK